MFRLAFVVVFALVATGVRAESTPALEEEVVSPEAGRVTGMVELRPSWVTHTGEFRTENTLALGYEFSPSFALTAVQYIDTNLHSRSGAEDVTVQDGFLGAKFNNVWVSPQSGWSFSYQPRFYLPTAQARRDAGLVTYIRNYLNFTKQVSPSFALTFTELPIFHLYSKAGVTTEDGASANPVFENRLYVIADWNLGAGFAFSLPLFFHQTRHADYVPGAENNNTWSYFLYTWPELLYTVDDNFTVGLSYYTGNFVADDLSDLTLADGFREGVTQIVLRASL